MIRKNPDHKRGVFSKLYLTTKIPFLRLFAEFREAARPHHSRSNPASPVPALPGTAKTRPAVGVKLLICLAPPPQLDFGHSVWEASGLGEPFQQGTRDFGDLAVLR